MDQQNIRIQKEIRERKDRLENDQILQDRLMRVQEDLRN